MYQSLLQGVCWYCCVCQLVSSLMTRLTVLLSVNILRTRLHILHILRACTIKPRSRLLSFCARLSMELTTKIKFLLSLLHPKRYVRSNAENLSTWGMVRDDLRGPVDLKTSTMMIAMAEVLFMIDVETAFVIPDVTTGRKKTMCQMWRQTAKILDQWQAITSQCPIEEINY